MGIVFTVVSIVASCKKESAQHAKE
ncbi:hypothetical protein [Capnocytophaga genosp. AHN8471]